MRVGLTGGIASGKSVAAAELVRLGVPVIDYDRLAHDVIAPGTAVQAEVAAAFGPAVMRDGQVDRAALSQVVFASDALRRQLESIVHPLVFEAAAAAETAALTAGHKVVVHEIPLLVEVMDAGQFDAVIVVDAPAWLRAQRLVDGRGLTAAQAAERIAAQASDEARLAVATVVWDGAGTVAELRSQVAAWAARLA